MVEKMKALLRSFDLFDLTLGAVLVLTTAVSLVIALTAQ